MYRRTAERTHTERLFLRSSIVSHYPWCYAKYTSNILNVMFLSFKELVIKPEIHPPKPSRWLRWVGKKKSSIKEQLYYTHTTNFLHHKFCFIQGSVTNGFFGTRMYEGVIPGMKYSFLIQFKWLVGTNCSFYSISCFYFFPPPAAKA